MASRATQYRAARPALVEHRDAVRHSILMTRSRAASNDSAPVQAQLHDVSVYGCRLACRVGHAVGERIWLRLPNDEPVAAQVMWNDGEHIGCRFDTPIQRSLMRALTLVM